MKVCPRCKEEKPLERFYLNRNAPDGRQAICKMCSNDNVYESRGYVLVEDVWHHGQREHRRFHDD